MKKILILGSSGLVGSAIRKISTQYVDQYVFYFHTRDTQTGEGDLTLETEVDRVFKVSAPDYVINCSAEVGGIQKNLDNPGKLFYRNTLMNAYVIHYSMLNKVKSLISFSSMCCMPDNLDIIREDSIHLSAPHKAHFAYGMAKRAVDVQITSYNYQYGTNFCSVIPSNLFGPHDMHNLIEGHVIPTLIHKVFLCKRDNTPLICWGTGKPLREFIYSEDVAEILMKLLMLEKLPERLIITPGIETPIRDVVNLICEKFNFKGEVIWDETKPDGQRSRPADNSLLKSYFPNFQFTSLEEGIEKTVKWFEDSYPNVRV